MAEYKQTLNLPKTSFPMKANLANREPATLQLWQNMKLHEKIQTARINAQQFVLIDGPPYANGDIHIGHAVNKSLKDFANKVKILSGLGAPYRPGWDCHGLPIELQVEKKFGKPNDKIDSTTFRTKCREYATKQIEQQKQGFMRLGVLGAWDTPYTTMDRKIEAAIIRTLGKVIANQHLVSGEKPVHWCTSCNSALAEAEVEYKDKESLALYVAFKSVDKAKLLQCFGGIQIATELYVAIWTTTPWTLPANMAVAVHAELNYVLIKLEDKCIIVTEGLLQEVITALNVTDYKVLATCKGEKLELQKLQHPLYDRVVPIVLGEHVTIDAGTGCVHTAPAHGLDDYIISRKYKLSIDNDVAGNGCFTDNAGALAGLHISKANNKIVEMLQESGVLLAQHKLAHSYPHCWRHKTPLIFRATKQWFISMSKNGLREQALRAIDDVEWFPKSGYKRMQTMLQNRPDWCISRQRCWGTPLTLIVHKKTGELHPNMLQLIETIAGKVEQSGIDVWDSLNLAELISDHNDYEKSTDTLDVWFDSGAIGCCLQEQGIADLYLEGSDQHRGWFQTSLLVSIAADQQAPYKQVLTHGFTVDANGHKMSKSVGNVVAPDKICKRLGADILRLWIAATDYSGDLRVSDEILNRISDAYRRIRNTVRFLLSNLHDFNESNIVPSNKLLALDQWLLQKTASLQQQIIQAYDCHQYHVVYQKIHRFCVEELGSFYLDIIKDRQYTCKTDSLARRSAQTAMYYVIESLVRWIAPILSFTAEEIWQHMPERTDDSVFLTTWEQQIPQITATEITSDDFWQFILQVKSEVNKKLESARNNGAIGSSLAAEVSLYCDQKAYALLATLADELRFVLITSNANLHKLTDEHTLPEAATEIAGVFVQVTASKHNKCERCWHHREDVGRDANYPGICHRCVINITSEGEKRQYA